MLEGKQDSIGIFELEIRSAKSYSVFAVLNTFGRLILCKEVMLDGQQDSFGIFKLDIRSAL